MMPFIYRLPTGWAQVPTRPQRLQPNQAWVADITYIRTRSDWLYLAAVLDLFSRKVVGWAMAPNMPAELVEVESLPTFVRTQTLP
jgi:transposase InsO family protein